MIYVRIAWAAIQRHRLEAPFRAQYREAFPGKRCTMCFGVLLLKMNKAGLIDIKKTRPVERKYKELSRIVHGNFDKPIPQGSV